MYSEFWDNLSLAKRLYGNSLEPVAEQYNMTRMELDILLFLTNNPEYDTATDIVNRRGLTKSHVSSSVRELTQKGFLERTYLEGNSKTVHLTVRSEALDIIRDGKRAQQIFFGKITEGLSEDDMRKMKEVLAKVAENIRDILKDGD